MDFKQKIKQLVPSDEPYSEYELARHFGALQGVLIISIITFLGDLLSPDFKIAYELYIMYVIFIGFMAYGYFYEKNKVDEAET
jgi:hypothetical protein